MLVDAFVLLRRAGCVPETQLTVGAGREMPGKRVQIDNESWAALDLLARDRMMTFQELADEAFADLLKKHGRPVDLRAALRKSAGVSADVIPLNRGNKKAAPRRRKK
jgi:hypothetical protein